MNKKIYLFLKFIPMSFLQNLDWRFASKSLDSTKKNANANLEKILYSIVMTPPSFGLEPYRVDIITDQP